VSAFAPGCATDLYELPPPPPPEERRSVSLIPGAEERKEQQRYLKAAEAVRTLYQLLSSKRYDEAAELLSAETRDLLGHRKGSAVEALASGRLVAPDGREIAFDPTTFLVAPNLDDLRDDIEGVSDKARDSETARREVLYAVQPDGTSRRIVVIKQGDQWVIHKTSIDIPPS
jgi:hypothetical protein